MKKKNVSFPNLSIKIENVEKKRKVFIIEYTYFLKHKVIKRRDLEPFMVS